MKSGLVYWPEFLITCNKCGQGNVVLEQSPGGMLADLQRVREPQRDHMMDPS